MKYAVLFLLAISFLSCQKESNLAELNETIYVRNNGADMPVYLRGNMASKVVILVIHGGPGGNGLEYRAGNWTLDLEENYAMAYWDQRGQGMSHGNYDKETLTVSQMVEDMDAVIKVLKAKFGQDLSVFVFGHSWGGTLSAKYMTTANLQQNVTAWIETNGAHDNPKNEIEATKLFIKVAKEQIAAGNNIENWEETLEWALAIDTLNISEQESYELNNRGFEVEEWLIEDGVLSYSESGGNKNSAFFGPINPLTSALSGSNTNRNLSEEVEAVSLTDELFKVTIPTLILWGKYDFVVTPALAYDTYNNISSSVKRLVIFEQSGHSPMNNEWRKYTDEILRFVDENK